MREQIAEHVYRGGKPTKHETIYITDEDNLSTTDDFIEEDEGPSNQRTRQVSIERICKVPRTPAANRTYLRVTRHAEPPRIERISRTTASRPQQQAKQKPVKQQVQKHKHWLFYVGSGMLTSMALWMVGSAAVSFAQTVHDNLTYGTPRTYQMDANVGHQGTSHFIVENLQGDILVMELHPSDLAETKVYQGPTFSGNDADTMVATISFQDVNGDGKSDMVIAVNNQRFVLINTGTAFRPTTPADHVAEVQ